MKTNWQIKKLGDICDFINGRSFKKTEWLHEGNESLPIIRIENLNNSNSTFNYFKGDFDDKILIKNGDLLFSWSGSIGTSFGPHIWKGDNGLLNQHIYKIVFDNKNIEKQYLYLALKELVATVEKNLHGGVGLVHITKAKLNNLEIPLPPLETQRKIVSILDEKFAKLREAKRLRQEAIVDTEKILAATLKEIFEEGKENGWEEKEMGDVLEKIVGGGTPSKAVSEYWNGDIPWASVKDLKEGQQLIERTKDFITQEGLQNSSANLIPKGALIISTRMGLGRVAKNTIDMAINQDLKALFPKKIIDIDFLILVLLTKSQEIISGGKGATVSGVTLDFFRKIKILVPSLTEQQKIVTRLDALSEKLRTLRELQRSQLEDMKKLEKAYLREAFRGELDVA